MVGLGGLEPPTSPLSVLRSLPPAPSNHPGRYISSIMDFYLCIGVRKWGRTARHEPPSLQILISFHEVSVILILCTRHMQSFSHLISTWPRDSFSSMR